MSVLDVCIPLALPTAGFIFTAFALGSSLGYRYWRKKYDMAETIDALEYAEKGVSEWRAVAIRENQETTRLRQQLDIAVKALDEIDKEVRDPYMRADKAIAQIRELDTPKS